MIIFMELMGIVVFPVILEPVTGMTFGFFCASVLELCSTKFEVWS